MLGDATKRAQYDQHGKEGLGDKVISTAMCGMVCVEWQYDQHGKECHGSKASYLGKGGQVIKGGCTSRQV